MTIIPRYRSRLSHLYCARCNFFVVGLLRQIKAITRCIPLDSKLPVFIVWKRLSELGVLLRQHGFPHILRGSRDPTVALTTATTLLNGKTTCDMVSSAAEIEELISHVHFLETTSDMKDKEAAEQIHALTAAKEALENDLEALKTEMQNSEKVRAFTCLATAHS